MTAGIKIDTTLPDVKVKKGTLLFKLVEATCHGFGVVAGNPGSIAGALNAIDALFKSVDINDTDETKARQLVMASVAFAVRELSATSLDKKQQAAVKKAFDAIRKNITNILEADTHVLAPGFFEYPAKLGLYKALREDLIKALRSARLDKKVTIKDLGGKLDSAFNSAVYRVLKAQNSYFETLNTALSTNGLGIAQHELDWKKYRTRLIEQFTVTPVFGQDETKISLSQLYIAPRARWSEEKKNEEGGNERGEKEVIFHTLLLEEDINDWILTPDPKQTIKLIYGGPGRGKSTFTKSLAADLAKKEGLRPLFIELQYVPLKGSLLDEVGHLLTKEEEAFQTNPLADAYKDPKRPFVLIFDGLDELAWPDGRGADNLARDFANALENLLRELNFGTEVRALAIVTGRDTIIKTFKERASNFDDCNALEACGYAPLATKKAKKKKIGIENIDQRPDWWKRFAEATGKPTDVPEAFVSEKLEDLSNEPLLSYLLAISDIATGNWEKLADNHNEIYKKLLHEVWKRKWGGGPKGPTQSFPLEKDFDLLMETMALAAWQGSSAENRIATEAEFNAACTLTYATETMKRFQKENDEDSLSSLALTFYFKRPNSDSDGIEFSHKSFCEYLVARFLFESAIDLAKDFKLPRSDASGLLKKWLEIAGSTCIDQYIFPFIQNEARTLDIDELTKARNSLEELFSLIIRDGMPAHMGTSQTWRQVEQVQRHGEIALLACLNAIIRELFKRDPATNILKFEWEGDSTTPARFIRRLVDNHGSLIFNILGFSHIDFSHVNEPFMNTLFIPDAELELCNFKNVNLANANLNRANLRFSNFNEANLSNASLFHANLSEAVLVKAKLSETSFRYANLTKTDFTEANLTGADFKGANLKGANFSGAQIEGAILLKGWEVNVKFDEDNPPIGTPKIEK